MKQFLNVLKFEYLSVCKNKSFIVSTVVFLILITIISFVPSIMDIAGDLFSGKKEQTEVVEQKKIFIHDADGLYSDELLTENLGDYVIERGEITDEIRSKVEASDYEFALSISGNVFTLYTGSSESFDDNPSDKIKAMIFSAQETSFLESEGLSADDIAYFQNIEVHSEVIILGKNFQYTFWYAYVLLFMLYMTILMYGQLVITSVATEKSTKTMELLITSVKPTTLMFGKVIGTGLAGLTQFLLILLVGGISLSLNLSSWLGMSEGVGVAIQFALSSNLVFFAVIFFILGFFQYAFVYAAFGSTITRLEEANSVVIFPMFIFIAAFMVSMLGMTSGASASYVTILSFVPFFSPLVMFMRMCVTEVSIIEVAAAILINIAAMFLVGNLGGRIYKTGVMLYGNPPKFGTILKYMIKG